MLFMGALLKIPGVSVLVAVPDMAVSMNSGSFVCGHPYNKSPTIWGLFSCRSLLETPRSVLAKRRTS